MATIRCPVKRGAGPACGPLTELLPDPHDLRHYFRVRLLDERVPAARARELLAGR